MVSATPDEIVSFWFGNAIASQADAESRAKLWFHQNDEFDRQIQNRFSSLPEEAASGDLDGWRNEPLPNLALILVVDQFPRNLYRNSARAFEFDPLGCEIALKSIAKGFDALLHPIEASFVYRPLEHAEDIELQERCVQLFEQLLTRSPAEMLPIIEDFTTYARQHRDVIQRFGRFPHRNAVLDRPLTPAEIAYLESGGETFS